MIKYIIIVLLAFATLSCVSVNKAQKRIAKIERDFPELFEADTAYVVKSDTITTIKEKIVLETLYEPVTPVWVYVIGVVLLIFIIYRFLYMLKF